MHDFATDSVQLVVTSPPYPMIEMWDTLFGSQNSDITQYLNSNPHIAFELMHRELDLVWEKCAKALSKGCIVCVNIGDATRTINGKFELFSNQIGRASCRERV